MNIETETELPKSRAGGMTDGLKNTKKDSTASAAELKDFVQKMRGKSPKEVMGEVAESSLVQGLIVSTISFTIIVAIFTVGPYFLYGAAEQNQASADDTPAATDTNDGKNTADATKPTQTDPVQGNQVATQNPDIPSGSDVKQASKNLGIDQTKTADPNTNPLDKNLDTLLDGLE